LSGVTFMADYKPLQLENMYNVGTAFIGADAKPKIGGQTFHGLPFQIGIDTNCCFIGLGPGVQPVTIPVNATAHNLIFAHALLESKVLAGESIGRVLAHYVVKYAGGATVRLPIRERFEVSMIPTAWGQWPFLAVPEQQDWLAERYAGQWSEAGRRQTEANYAHQNVYYLWAWRNPNPEWVIEMLTIEPGERKFLVAAITLGEVDEEPFYRQGRRPVKITLPQDSDKAFELEIDVDRGVASYPYPLPIQPAEDFLNDELAGFGETKSTGNSPAYVEIAATPSATVTVRVSNVEVGHAKWGELEAAGNIQLPGVSLEVADPGRNWVHVTVVDDTTGQPLPCRVHFRSPEGIPYQPDGHHNHIHGDLGTWHIDIGGDLRLGQATYAYIDGRCQGWLPRGEVIVDVARGFEYEPLRTRVHIEPGQRELTLRLKRWTNMNERRWFSGDSHVHFLGVQGAHYEAQAEDLNVVNLLASQWGHLFTNTEDFIGGPTLSNNGSTIIYAAQENRQHILGHLTLWGLKQPVSPRGSGGPDEGALGGTLEVTMAAWADKAHAQGGTVIIPHLPDPNGEPAALIATGRADAVEMIRHGAYLHDEYYRYLNAGYRLPLVGGTDKMSSEVPVGLYRTYAFIPPDQPFTYDAWTKAVRAGRTFLSGGPILTFTVGGAQIGDTITLQRGGTLEVEATAESIFPIHSLQIVQQGRVVASTEAEKGARRLHLKEKVKVDSHTWLAARCGGPGYSARSHHDVWNRGIFAHTSPIYVAVGGEWRLFDQAAAEYMLTLIEGSLAYIHQRAAYYPETHVSHHHGEADHMAYLERPFHEAIEALHRRMHQLGNPP
jgi:hypothetical protein